MELLKGAAERSVCRRRKTATLRLFGLALETSDEPQTAGDLYAIPTNMRTPEAPLALLRPGHLTSQGIHRRVAAGS